MSKPILSELEYNAADVASAILAKADLSVTNQDFAVTDITSSITAESGVTVDSSNNKAYHFNGFVFLNLFFAVDNPSGNVHLATIDNSDYHPQCRYFSNSISYQGDFVNSIIVYPSTGYIEANSVNVGSGSDDSFRINVNMWYRT